MIKLKNNRSDRIILKLYAVTKLLKKCRALKYVHSLFKPSLEVKNLQLTNSVRAMPNIHICLRHVSYKIQDYPVDESRPDGFSYEKCINNLVYSIKSSKHKSNIKLTVYYDGDMLEFERDKSVDALKKSEIPYDLKLVEGGTALKSWLIMLRDIKKLPIADYDLIYILENDYYHDSNWIDYILDLYSSGINFDYLTLYDHPDRYKFPDRYRNTNLYLASKRHWIETTSTCASFLVSFKMFKKDFKFFYTHRPDISIFTTLTSRKGRRILMPLPALSTHAMKNYLAPLTSFEFKNE